MAKYIEKHIEQTFLDMAKKEKIDKITVSELVEQSQVNRKTFYNHYSGIGDLTASLIERKLLSAFSDEPNVNNWIDITCRVFYLMKDNALICHKVYDSKIWPEVELRIKKILQKEIEKFVDNAVILMETEDGIKREMEEKDKKYVVTFYTTMMSSMAAVWFEGGMKEPVEEYVDNIDKLCNKGVFAGIEKYSDKNM